MYRIVDNKKQVVSVAHSTLALFGGSFDPFHATHLAIAHYVHAHCNVEYVVLVPTKQNPFKSHRMSVESDSRIAMIHTAVNNCPYILIDDFELRSEDSISYTHVTIKYIKDTYHPAIPLHLVIGADTLNLLDKWKHIQEMLEWVTLLVIPRKQYELHIPPTIKKNAVHVLEDFPISDLSSSDIRSVLHKKDKEHVSELKKLLPATVYRYIQEHNLY